MKTVERTWRMLGKSAVKSASRTRKRRSSAAAAAVARPVTLGEYAAVLVGDRQLQRAAIPEIERDVGADEGRSIGHVRELDGAFDAVHAWDRQARHRHALKAADSIGNRADRPVAPA